MSTKAIDAVLRCLRNGTKPSGEDVSEATREMEAIREAAKTLDRLHVGDFTYKIRDRVSVIVSTHHSESTWNHPDVKAWSDASMLMGTIAKETP